MAVKLRKSQEYRIAGVLFFIATVLMSIGAVLNESPVMLFAAVLQGVAWLMYVCKANQLEAKELLASGGE